MKIQFNDDEIYELTKQAEKDLAKAYKLSLKNVDAEIKKLYGKMSKPITLEQAQKYKRLSKLKQNILAEINFLTSKKDTIVQRTLNAQYADSYYQTGWNVQKGTGFDFDFYKLNTPAIVEAANNPIVDLTIPKLFANHKQQLIRNLNIDLMQGLIQGMGYVEMSKQMANRMGMDANKAKTVAWTEGHRVMQKARLDSIEYMENAGLNGKKQWLATLDKRTRPAHQAADGQQVKTDKNFIVGGMQMMYPGDPKGGADNTVHCRCTMLYIVDDQQPLKRRAGGKTLDYKTYDEWKGNLPKQPTKPKTETVKPKLWEEKIKQYEDKIRNRKTEKAYFLDEDGNVLFEKSGKKNTVNFTQTEWDKLKGFKKSISTHNHPNDSPFSFSDFNLSNDLKQSAMRVASAKNDYQIDFKKHMNSKTLEEFKDAFDANLVVKTKEAQLVVREHFKKHGENGIDDLLDKLNIDVQHENWIELQKEYSEYFDYRRWLND